MTSREYCSPSIETRKSNTSLGVIERSSVNTTTMYCSASSRSDALRRRWATVPVRSAATALSSTRLKSLAAWIVLPSFHSHHAILKVARSLVAASSGMCL
ncbi:MAG: hypothetical protein E6J90_28525 [Deltaproteobacteria bacterium]|nr:MAG: hypothetical protein E6J90_28525 [Deltaproteobacteria bacterium]